MERYVTWALFFFFTSLNFACVSGASDKIESSILGEVFKATEERSLIKEERDRANRF